MSSIIENPFINNKCTIIHQDENTGESVELNQSNIPKYYSEAYILVKKNNTPIPSDFYGWQVPEDIFNQVSSNLIIYKVSVKILKNKSHWDSMIIMSNDFLQKYNIFNYELKNKNVVVPIFNICYLNLLQYVQQYESENNLENIYKMKVLNKYFGVNDDNHKSNVYMSNVINSIEESNYWTNYYNCLVNMTNKFKNRNFSFQHSRMSDQSIAKVVKEIFDEKVTSSNNSNYIKEIEVESKKDDYVDVSTSVIDKKGFKLYKISSKSQFNQQDINQLFSTLNEKQRFLLFANLMISKKHCHLVVNNSHVLDLMKKEITNFAPLFRYLMSYAWIRFYFEECLKKTYVKTNDDFIFDINTASKLPVFPFDHNKPKDNPYMPIMVADSELKPSDNLCGIPSYLINSDSANQGINGQGICNLDEFKIRMNIFCTGNPNNNMFDGFDFEKNKVAITGSIITACIQKQHPLMSRFANCDTLTERFRNYFNEYYAKSDIDVMFMAKDDYTFIDNVKEFHNQLLLNVCKFNSPYAEPSHVKLVLNKLGYLFVSSDWVNSNISFGDESKDSNKVKYIIDNINDPEVKAKFKPYYEKLKAEKYEQLIHDFSEEEVKKLKLKYPEVFAECSDFKIYINKSYNQTGVTSHFVSDDSDELENMDEEKEPITLPSIQVKVKKDIDLEFTYKFKIESPHLNHCLELFPVKYDDFFSIVARFHLPCVRGYYNGSNVYLTPSCISAHMTYMNLDYKYITGTKDPLDIINKNRMRGFGTWINSNEKKLFSKYSRQVPFWNKFYTLDPKATDSDANKNIFGIMQLNHKIFRPRLYNMDEYIDSVYVDTTNRYNDSALPVTLNGSGMGTTQSIVDKFKSIDIKKFNFDKFTSIDKNGYVVPVKRWIINSVWEVFNSEYKFWESKKQDTVKSEPEPVKKSANKTSILKKLVQNNAQVSN
jgi:hypothetical protein